MTAQQGGCLCGGIRYEVAADPRGVTICHCRFCQRATGGAYLIEPIFGAGDHAVVHGEPTVYAAVSEGSGKTVHVHFCAVCGTKVHLSFERWTDIVGVYAGTFDDPSWFDISPENAKQIFLSSAQRGAPLLPGINALDEHAQTRDGEPVLPRVGHDLAFARPLGAGH